jgi:hypothetical protein
MPEFGASISIRRDSLRPLHRRGLARSADAHARLAERGGEARHRRNAGAGRCVYGMTSARRRLKASPRRCCTTIRRIRRRVADRRQDSRLRDAEAAGAAVQQQLPRQLHADRLRVALARQMARAVRAAALTYGTSFRRPLGVESGESLCREPASKARPRHRHRLRLVAGMAFGLVQRSVYHRERTRGARRGVYQLSPMTTLSTLSHFFSISFLLIRIPSF